jgi:hypothetical protein
MEKRGKHQPKNKLRAIKEKLLWKNAGSSGVTSSLDSSDGTSDVSSLELVLSASSVQSGSNTSSLLGASSS